MQWTVVACAPSGARAPAPHLTVLQLRSVGTSHPSASRVSPLGERRSAGASFEHRRCEVGLTGRGASPPPLSLTREDPHISSTPPRPASGLLSRTCGAQTPVVRYAPGSRYSHLRCSCSGSTTRRTPPQGRGQSWRYAMDGTSGARAP